MFTVGFVQFRPVRFDVERNIAHPANLVLPYCQQSMLTRSLENGVYSITANRFGVENLGEQNLAFTGASQVVDTHGIRMTQAPLTGNCIEIVQIDPSTANDKHITPRNDIFTDRRPGFYQA